MVIGDSLRSVLSRVGGFVAGAGALTGSVFATMATYTTSGPIVGVLLVAAPAVLASLAAVIYTARGIRGVIDLYNERQTQLGVTHHTLNHLQETATLAAPAATEQVAIAVAAGQTEERREPQPQQHRLTTPPQRVRSLNNNNNPNPERISLTAATALDVTATSQTR